MKKCVVLFVFLIIFSICFTVFDSKKISNVSGTRTQSFTPYVINIPVSREKAIGEKSKCMSGVDIDNENMFKNIYEFEKITGVNNDVYIKTVNENDGFPAEFIIDTAAKGKISNIILNNINDITYIKSFAQKCGSLSVPVFVSVNCGSIAEKYNRIAEVFRKEAPKTILMWNISLGDNLLNSPKAEYIDWISINYSEKIEKNGVVSDIENLKSTVKYFSAKPVALNLSVECFSGINHKYYTKEWVNEIKNLYSLADDYENIGIINYMGNSVVSREDGSSGLSDSSEIRMAYKEAVEKLPQNREWTSTDKIAYVVNDTAYIDIESASLLNIKAKYANTAYVATKNYSVDKSKRKMFVY